jgi:acetyltransferase
MPTFAGEPLRLADTRRVWLRPLSFDDAPRLVDLCQRISPESRRRRFLRSTIPCDVREAERFASIDQAERVALAVVPNLASDAPIIGVGRFHAENSARAELALLVDDEYQRVGLGRVLLSRLADHAFRRGLRVLIGHVLYDNQPMLHLLRTSGHPVQVRWDGGDVLSVEVDMRQPAAIAESR